MFSDWPRAAGADRAAAVLPGQAARPASDRPWSPVRSLRSLVRPASALAPGLLLVAAWLAVTGPLVSRATASPRLLAAFVNDEPFIASQLIAMKGSPVGDPANWMRQPERRPPEWDSVPRFFGVYYGGTYLGLAFAVWAPLSLLGLPDFPTAPLVLRAISLGSAAASLLLLYALARRLSGMAAASFATFFMATNGDFNYYAAIIHPDALQMLLGLGVLALALRHAERGGRGGVVWMSLLIGAVQGTKMGGPWLVPIVLVSIARGLVARGARPTTAALAAHAAAVGVLAFLGWFLTTPYAFIDPFFFERWRESLTIFQTPIMQTGLVAWLRGLWEWQGGAITVAAGVAIVFHGLRARNGSAESGHLATVGLLAVSIFLWTVLTVRIWVTSSYLALVFALSAWLAGDITTRVLRAVAARSRPATLALVIVAAVLLAPTVQARTRYFLYQAAFHSLQGRPGSTVVDLGRWAQRWLPEGSRILSDDAAYFDHQRFPEFRVRGALMTYGAIEEFKPDFVVLSNSLYDAPWVQELRRSRDAQPPGRPDLSVRFYQDVLDRQSVDWLRPLRVFSPRPLPVEAGALLRVLWDGPGSASVGPELRLYKVRATRWVRPPLSADAVEGAAPR